MNKMLCLAVATTLSVAFASFPTSVPAQVTARQIKLTEHQIEGFIAAQDDMSALVEKTMSAASSDSANTQYEAELEAVTKKHGFRDIAEFDAVGTSIYMVMAGINQETKVFTDPQMAIKKEIKDVRSDKSISTIEKRHLLEQLGAAFKAAEPIRFPTNIELVKKHYSQLELSMIGTSDDKSRSVSSVMRTSRE